MLIIDVRTDFSHCDNNGYNAPYSEKSGVLEEVITCPITGKRNFKECAINYGTCPYCSIDGLCLGW